jgi:hypothetical protein
MAIEIWFRNADWRFPFMWDGADQPPARWHAVGRGPVQYASDTPEGAWAEFIRHEGITDPNDLRGVSRSLWALEVDLDDETLAEPSLAPGNLLGDLDSYLACQAEAERLHADGASGLISPAAALLYGAACGEVVESGEVRPGPVKDGRTLCLFGPRPHVVGHQCVEAGQPPERVLALTRQLELH